jgi:hypothetical protein
MRCRGIFLVVTIAGLVGCGSAKSTYVSPADSNGALPPLKVSSTAVPSDPNDPATKPHTVKDNFAGKNALGVALTGQAYTVKATAGAGDFTVENGELTAHPTGNVKTADYAVVALRSPVRRMGADFVFNPPKANGASAVLSTDIWKEDITTTYPRIPDSPAHLSVTAKAWELLVWNGGQHVSLGSGALRPLAMDGETVYRVDMQIAGDTVTISLPDGSQKTVTDPRIASNAGRFAGWEIFTTDPVKDGTLGILRTWAD